MEYIDTPRKAELNAANKMRQWGFVDAVASPVGADGGIDVRSSRALAQVKWKASKAGRPDLQRFYGARGTDTRKALLFFASAGYSREAIEYADQLGISLFVYDLTGRTTAVNNISTARPTGRSWVSPEYLALMRGFQRVLRVVAVGTTKRRPRRR